MKQIATAALLLAVTTTQASALSCIRPDMANAFKQASDSDLSYVVLYGKFAFDPLPKTEEPQAQTTQSQFAGRLLTGAGFTQNVEAPITINLSCAGEWCATMEPDTDYIAFVEQRDNTLVFDVGPCYGFAFANPSQEDVKRLENCAQGGACEAKGS